MIETLGGPCYTGGPERMFRRSGHRFAGKNMRNVRPADRTRSTMSEAAKDLRADALVASYERAGYARVAPAMLQPAEPFLDLSGEDIRRRMYLVNDPAGRELCLRPDPTLPAALAYLPTPPGRPPA